MLASLIALSLSAAPPLNGVVFHADTMPSNPVMGQCNPIDGPVSRWPAELKAETRARVAAVCRWAQASNDVCEYLQVVLWRESWGGHAGARHDDGAGLGPMGLALKAHADKWPGQDEDPMFCVPEVSALVALAILRRAVTRWNARDLIGINSIYAGRWRTYVLEDGSGLRAPRDIANPGLCRRLEARGVGCRTPVLLGDLGRRVPYSKRRGTALALNVLFTARQDAIETRRRGQRALSRTPQGSP